jgi:hypothetical protein
MMATLSLSFYLSLFISFIARNTTDDFSVSMKSEASRAVGFLKTQKHTHSRERERERERE